MSVGFCAAVAVGAGVSSVGGMAVGVTVAGVVAVGMAVAGSAVLIGAATVDGGNAVAMAGGVWAVGRASQAVRIKATSRSSQLSRRAKGGEAFVRLAIDSIVASYTTAFQSSNTDLTGRRPVELSFSKVPLATYLSGCYKPLTARAFPKSGNAEGAESRRGERGGQDRFCSPCSPRLPSACSASLCP